MGALTGQRHGGRGSPVCLTTGEWQRCGGAAVFGQRRDAPVANDVHREVLQQGKVNGKVRRMEERWKTVE
jgi:hypothetical protein